MYASRTGTAVPVRACHRRIAQHRESLVVIVAHPRPTRLYEHVLPRSLMQEWLAAGRPGDDDPYGTGPDIGRPEEEVTDVVDTGHVLDRRERAIAMHASQTSPFAGLDPDLGRRFLTADHLVRLC